MSLELTKINNSSPTSAVRMSREYDSTSNRWSSDYFNSSSSYFSDTQQTTTATSGRLRIERSGTSVKFYYTESGTEYLMSTLSSTGNIDTDEVFVRIYCHGKDVGAGLVEIANVHVSGSTSTRPGWARESFGPNRGNFDLPVSCPAG